MNISFIGTRKAWKNILLFVNLLIQIKIDFARSNLKFRP